MAASPVSDVSPTPGSPVAGDDKLIDLVNVSKRFGGVQALDDVSFDVYPGEVLCLAGENGCGKSTLIKVISGVHAPEPGGQIRFDGELEEAITPARARALGIQVIWQDLALFPEMTVAENIAFEQNLGGNLRVVNYSDMRRKAAQILDRLGVRIGLDRSVKDLSIASRQLVAIARALVADARLVFMDEPTASLSRAETDALLAIVRRLSADNIAVVFVSHRLAEVLDVCNRVTVLRDGKLVGTFPTENMTQTRLTELMTGQAFDQTLAEPKSFEDKPLLRVKGLTRRHEFKNVDLSIRPGEVVGLTGRLGAGRTELALCLFGMKKPDAGTIELDGKPLTMRSNRDAIEAGIAYVSEDRLSLGLVQPQAIGDNTVVSVLDRIVNEAGLISTTRKKTLIDHWVERLRVKIGHRDDAVSTLSGGNQQRVVLAKWLATKPRLLILDSPTVGVDVGARAGIFRIVQELAAEGMAILLVSDEATEVYFNADRVLHMRDGAIVGEFVPATTSAEAIEEAVNA